MNGVNCVCINDKDRPEEVPADCWPKKDKVYTIVHVYYHPIQRVQGVDLKEMKPPKSAYPYETYKLSRFAIPEDDLDKFIQMVKDCNELDNVDLDDLKKELEPDLDLVEVLK